MKKIIIFCLIFSGCFGCLCSDILPKWNITEFNISIYDFEFSPPIDGVVEGDSIQLGIDFTPEFVDAINFNSISLINSAYATSCVEPGYEGLEDKISKFNVTSNSKFNEFESGESLNSIIRVYGDLTIDEWILDSDDWLYEVNNQVNLFINQKPIDSIVHKFTIKIEFESGKLLESSSEEIQWN